MQEYQNKELVDLARMDKIYAERGSSKKGDAGMAEAVGSAEGVREWRYQMQDTEDLAKDL